MDASQPIGFFDSGIGGISIWQAVYNLLPHENTVYLADNINAPYGDKSIDEIIQISEKNTEFLLNKNVKLIVVACNTASTVSIPHLRQKYDVPFIRIQPAIKPAGLQSKTNSIGLLATKRTLESEMLKELKQIIPTPNVNIVEQYGKGLVEVVEEMKIEHHQTRQLLQKYIQPMLDANVDQLVLGCTHYPFLISEIKKITGNRINIIEPGKAIAKQAERVLNEIKLLNKSGSGQHYFFANKSINALEYYLKEFNNIRIELLS
jgi:glutamate racemase